MSEAGISTPRVVEVELTSGEAAPCDHVLELYDDDEAQVAALVQFAAGGLESGDGVVVIAQPAHLRALHHRLGARDQLLPAIERDQYIPVDAEHLLAEFMDDGWPDRARFEGLVDDLLTRGRGHGRRVRIYSELVSVLWAQGNEAAAVRLEQLWEQRCRQQRFRLLCVYPRGPFVAGSPAAAREVCETHTFVHAS
jgi:hypothetical protein